MRVSPRASAALRAGRPRSQGDYLCKPFMGARRAPTPALAALPTAFAAWIPSFAGITGEEIAANN